MKPFFACFVSSPLKKYKNVYWDGVYTSLKYACLGLGNAFAKEFMPYKMTVWVKERGYSFILFIAPPMGPATPCDAAICLYIFNGVLWAGIPSRRVGALTPPSYTFIVVRVSEPIPIASLSTPNQKRHVQTESVKNTRDQRACESWNQYIVLLTWSLYINHA